MSITEITPSRAVVRIAWRDVPHLSEQAQDEMRRATPQYMISAREDGSPSMGSGRIYPVDIRELLVPPFEIPAYWRRCFGMDVGWRRTAGLWLAWDSDNDVVYFYSEHYAGGSLPTMHAEGIKARGAWIPGLIDPASNQRAQRDGVRLFEEYKRLGLNLIKAENAVESGIYKVNELIAQGRLFIFSNLVHFQDEYNIYRRDENGKIVKSPSNPMDHLLDCARYAVQGYEMHAITRPVERRRAQPYSPGVPAVGY